MMSSVRNIGVLTGSCQKLIQMFQENLPSSKYKFTEIHFDNDKLLNQVAEEKLNVAKQINEIEILIADPSLVSPVIYEINGIKWCHSTWAGVDSMTNHLIEGKMPNFLLTRHGGVFGQQMSEYVVSNIVNFERRAFEFYNAQKESQWKKGNAIPGYRLLSELSITILGVGDIGRVVGKNCKDFGMTVHAMVTKIPTVKHEFVDEYFTCEELTEYLEKSDYVCNILPITHETNNILAGDVLKHCEKKQSVFINIGRGNVISEEGIVQALNSGWIRGAVLDVFRSEPLPSDCALWTTPNVIITPHVSGITINRHLVEAFIKQLELYEEGKKLRYIVDWHKKY